MSRPAPFAPLVALALAFTAPAWSAHSVPSGSMTGTLGPGRAAGSVVLALALTLAGEAVERRAGAAPTLGCSFSAPIPRRDQKKRPGPKSGPVQQGGSHAITPTWAGEP
jgi:hypothetical protein